MRKKQKEQLLEILQTLNDVHTVVKEHIKKGNLDNALSLLDECQKSAIYIGEFIDETEGEGCVSVRFLEMYCEELYRVATGLLEGVYTDSVQEGLEQSFNNVKQSVDRDIVVRLEVAFLPYKASMWDSLESIWKAADEDPNCDAYVIPIPYYDRNANGLLGEFHYEGELFPGYVPITSYTDYPLEKHMPDVIYIHNPYDDQNSVTSIEPRFYSSELRKYTEMLVYVPYYVVAKRLSNESLITTPAFVCAHRIILQSQEVSRQYAEMYDKISGKIGEADKKMVALGSPKFDAVLNAKKEDNPISEEWQKIIKDKKIVFLNTSIGTALQDCERFLRKLQLIIDDFKKRNDLVLWWRPHPLLGSTIMCLKPCLAEKYFEIVDRFKQNQVGIYDDTPNLQRAIVWGDIYYSDVKSSVFTLCCATGKPVVYIADEGEHITSFDEDSELFVNDNSSLDVLLRNENVDGTCGAKIHEYICQEVMK